MLGVTSNFAHEGYDYPQNLSESVGFFLLSFLGIWEIFFGGDFLERGTGDIWRGRRGARRIY